MHKEAARSGGWGVRRRRAGSATSVCLYGTDTKDCGPRMFAFPAADSGPTVPDDSCATSLNGLCEDGLMYSR